MIAVTSKSRNTHDLISTFKRNIQELKSSQKKAAKVSASLGDKTRMLLFTAF